MELLGLNTITPSAAAELAKHCGKLTIGSSDFRLGADSAECLAQHSGPVVLGGVKSVTVEVGPEKRLTLVKVKEMLVNVSDGSVYVDGFDFEEFTHIDDDAADFLGAQQIAPPYLALRGLVTISPSAAASLGALVGKCVVDLGGISELTDEAAEAMAPFKNHFMQLPNTATKILAKARKRLKDKRR